MAHVKNIKTAVGEHDPGRTARRHSSPAVEFVQKLRKFQKLAHEARIFPPGYKVQAMIAMNRDGC
jgi:hypothetical protein